MPTLSIIIPVYNAEQYLEACINSVLANNFKDYEIIVIDDGSKDGTGDLCDKLAEKHSNICVFHTQNQGLSAARNLGLDKAKGKFIGFVDADDVIAPDMFNDMVNSMTESVQLSMCDFHRCKREDISGILKTGSRTVFHLNQAETAKRICCGNVGPYVWNKLYIKEILDQNQIRFITNIYGAEDQFFNIDYILHCKKTAYIKKKMYGYIITEGSIMNSFRKNRVVDKHYISLPRAWRYTSEALRNISEEVVCFSQAKSAMFYQTVLRKLQNPDSAYINESIEYVKTHKKQLRLFKWGIKYYISALLLCANYKLWAKIFRYGMD